MSEVVNAQDTSAVSKSDGLNQLVRDIYTKENPEKAKRLTDDIVNNIVSTYGNDYKQIVKKIYERENPEKAKRLSDDVYSNISKTYGFDTPEPPATGPQGGQQPPTYIQNQLRDKGIVPKEGLQEGYSPIPELNKPQISATESLHSRLPYFNVEKKQVVPSIQEPKKDVSFDENAATKIGQENTVQNIIPQTKAPEEEYFNPAIKNTGGAQINSNEEPILSEEQKQWANEHPTLNSIFSLPGMGIFKEAYIGTKKAIGGLGTTLDVIASNISNSIAGGAQIDEQGNITYPWEKGYKQDKSEFYNSVRKFEEETPASSGGTTAFLGQLLPQTAALAATVLMRSPTATKAYLASMYGSSFGNGVETYDDYIKETGKQENPTDRYLVGMGYGAAEYIGEKVGLDYFMPKGYGKLVAKSLDASPSMAKEIGKSVLENYAKLTKQPLSAILKKIAIGSQVEGGQEVATELMDIAIDKWLTGKDVTGQEIRDRLLQSYGGGALMGAGIAPFAHVSQNAATTQRRRDQGKVTVSIDEEGLPVEIVQSGDKVFGIRPDGEEVKNISQSTIDKAQTLKTEDFEKAISQYKKTGSITTATIEGQQYTINNPEDLGVEGKPIFAKDAEGNVTAVPNHKVENPVTQTLDEIDQANQQEAERVKLYEGIADPNAQIINEVEDNGARFIDFSNGQTKIIFNGQEVIANDVNEKDRILESIVKDNQLPEPKIAETGEVISPAPEKKVVTQKFGNTPIDIIENEGYDEVVPSEKVPLEKALPALEKKFENNPKFELKVERVQVEEPGETKYDDPVKKTVIKSIRIVPKVAQNANIEDQNVEKVSETQQQLADQQNVENIQSVESSQNNQLLNEEPENVDRQVSGTAQQTENTPQEEQGQGVNKGLEENVNDIAVTPVATISQTPGDSAELNIAKQEKANAKKTKQQARQISPEEQKQRKIDRAKALSIEPSTIEQLVLQYIVAGNRLNWDEIKREIFPRSDSEMKQRIWMLKKDAKTIDQLLGLLNGTPMEEEGNQPNVFRNAVIDVVLRNGTRTQMVNRILEIGDQNNNQQNIADLEQRMAEAAELAEQEERNNEFLALDEYFAELENSGELPSDIELIELFLQDNTSTNEQEINQTGSLESDGSVNPEENEGNRQVVPGSKPGSDGRNAISESQKELTPLEKEIQSLQKERAELLSKKVKTVKNVNARNGLFGDIAAQPGDLFSGQGFDATEAQRIIKSIDDRISVIDQAIVDLTAKNEQVKATAEKENAGQQELVIHKKSAVKEPWQMTAKERYDINRKQYIKENGLSFVQKNMASLDEYKYGSHKKLVEKALSEGKPVPEEVLNDYPELKNNAQFRTSDKPYIQETIDELQEKAPSAAPVVIVQSLDDVPQQVKDHKDFNPNVVEAFWFNGKIYIMPDMIKSRDHLIAIWIHENGLHNGIRNIVSFRDMRLFMNSVYDSFIQIGQNNPEFQKIIDRVNRDYRNFSKQAKAEEFLAYLSERVVSEQDLTPMEQTLWQKYLDMFRDFLRRLFNFDSNLLTEKQIVEITRFAVQSNFQQNELAGSNTRNGRGIRQRTSSDANGSERSAVMASGIQNETDRRGTSDIRSGRILDRNGTGLTIFNQASEDLKNRHNALDAITRIGTELNIPIQVLNSSELTSDNNQLVFSDNGTVTIVSDRVKSVSEVIKSLVKEVASENGIREMLAGADPNSIIGKQLAKFDELSPEELQSDKLAQIIRKAFRLTSNQFTNEDLNEIRFRIAPQKPVVEDEYMDQVKVNGEWYSKSVLGGKDYKTGDFVPELMKYPFERFEDRGFFNPAYIKESDWNAINKHLTKQGFAKRPTSDWINYFTDKVKSRQVYDEHLLAFESVFGKEEKPEKTDMQKFITKAKRYFGTTNNFYEAGYLLQDGSMLDFSGRKHGNRYPQGRAEDHREISSVDENSDVDMVSFMANGNIRMKGESDGFELTQEPTPEQIKTLKNYIRQMKDGALVDFSIPGSYNNGFSMEYGKSTRPERIINDILNYYRNDVKPVESNTVRFRIIGETGAANLDKAEEATTRLDNLAIAREMSGENPLDKYLQRYFEKGSSLDNEELLDYYGLKRFNLQNKYGFAVLSLVQSKEYGRGSGTKIMNDLIRWADKNKISIALTPDTSFGATSVSRLKSFYGRFGFVDNKGKNKEWNTRESMIRVPKKHKQFTPQQIRLATGWEKSGDGKWRYEVPDSKNINPISSLKRKEIEGREYIIDKLNNLVNDPELFKTYPELNDVNVVLYNFEHPDYTSGEYRSKSKSDYFKMDASITLWGIKYSNDRLPESKISTLYHEIQHAIQDYENFAQGGNEGTVSMKDRPDNPKWAEWNSEQNQAKIKEYKSIIETKEYLNERDESNKLFSEEFEPIIDKLDEERNSENNREISDKVQSVFDEFYKVSAQKFPTLAKADEISKGMIYNEPPKKISGRDIYHRLAGEVESRNVQTRMNMTPEERLNTLLSETEDVAREDQIVLMDGLGVSNLEEQIPETITVNGVERPTRNSKGQFIHTTKEGIENFYRWFQDSKVVDENGRPLVVYHGTNSDFDEFHDKYHKESFFFTTDKELALSYGTRTVEAYLSLQTPLDTNSNIEYTDVFYDKQKRGEYDGIIYNSETEKGEPINSIVAFSPSQIKSAIGNSGKFDPNNPDIRFRFAFHGSPHSFDKFSLSKIGTGEGAQAYGWGLYFTDKKAIAEEYAKQLAKQNEDFYFNGDKIKDFRTIYYIIKNLDANGKIVKSTFKNAYQDAIESYNISKNPTDKFTSEILKNILEAPELFESKANRNLYTVKIHGDKTLEELNFLRWDKPLTENQIDQIVESGKTDKLELSKDKDENGKIWLGIKRPNGRISYSNTGENVYKNLNDYEFNSQKNTSLFLLKSGIDGIIYPTEYTTKGTHEEAYNYVVFDENAVQIQEHTRFRIAPRDKRFDQLREDLGKITSLARSEERLKELEESKIGKKVAERKAIIKQISGYKQGYKAGANEKRFTLYVIQRYITKYANENINYDEATKGEIQQLLTAMQNANTPAKIAKAFERIDELASKGIKRKLINRIAKLLKNIAPKIQSGKPVGNISPEAYQALSKIQKIIEMSPEEYDQYLEEIPDGDIESMALASMFGNLKEKSIDNLFEALKSATSIKKDGKLWYKEKIDELKEKHKKLIDKAVDDITGGKGIQSSQQIRADKGVVDKNSSFKEYLSKNLSFEWLLDLISNNKKDRTGYGFMQDHFGDLANKSENEESKGIRDTLELINEKAFEIFGKEKSSLAKIFSKNSKVVKKSGVTYNTNDGRKEIPLSQNEAYKRWMEMNDPTLTATFEKMGWDAQSMEELEKFIDPKVMKWAQWQINEFFPKYYERVNNIYKEMYFADLPFNPNYSGYLKREKTSVGDKEDSMLRPSTLIQSVANSSLKSRIKNTRDIMLQDGDNALARHIAEMEHFIAWAESIREIRAVLSSDVVQDAIKKEHGNNIRTVLNERINSLVRGGVDRGEVNYLVDWIRKNYVTSALGINVSLTPKQMTAIFSYLNDISIIDYIKGASEFIANPAKAIEALNDSEFIKRRYEKGWTHEIVAAMKRDNPNTLAGTKSKINAVRDALMLPIMLGDKFAVYSGYPVYSKFFKEYKANNPLSTDKEAHDFAINKFERVAKRTQQSSDVTDTSRFQETSLGKVFMMFKNQQQQYFRYEMAAINNLIKGKGSKAENAKIILLTHIVLPVIFQMVANWFTDEDDDKERMRLLRAALLGPLDGLMIAGDIIGYGLERLMGEKWSYSASPMFDTVQDLGSSIDNMIKYIDEPYPEKEAEDLQKALDFAVQFTSSTMTGIPYEPAKRVYNKITGSEKDKRTEEQASEIIRNADEFRKFVKEAAKRNDKEAFDLFTKDENVTSSVSIISKYDSRIQKLKKAIKHYEFIKDKKKVDELEKLLDQTYKELIEKYKDLDFPKYKLNK